MAKDNVPVIELELVDQNDSGFVLDGTEGTPFEERLRAPEIKWIPNTGKEPYKDEKGVTRVRPIRHIASVETIDPEEQTKRGFKPNSRNDKIKFVGGRATIRREGNTIGLYDFLTKSNYFLDNPLRLPDATAIFRKVRKVEQAQDFVERDRIETEAKALVYQLQTKTGDSKAPYKYDEARIETFCRLMQIQADSPEEAVAALLILAKENPEKFVSIIQRGEQVINTEVTHGLELNVILFDGNTVAYAESKQVIKALKAVNGQKLDTDEKRVDNLAKWFGSDEGRQAYEDFKVHLSVAKEKKLQK